MAILNRKMFKWFQSILFFLFVDSLFRNKSSTFEALQIVTLFVIAKKTIAFCGKRNTSCEVKKIKISFTVFGKDFH